jgi:peptide/nickel transport system substrate-binding protein/oligopeptide transport system substrate-binding protein
MTYTFKLRPGVKFHNGREMTAEDVKYSLDRVTNPKTQSPAAGFFASIKGSEGMSAGTTESLEGVTVVDPADGEDRAVAAGRHLPPHHGAELCLRGAQGEVDKHGADFGKNPVGTGAYKLAEWTLGQRLVFERNQDYWREGLPYLDQITFEVGQDPTVALLRLQRGEVDVLGDPIPPAQFLQVRQDPQYKDWIVEGGQLHTGYLTMNVKTPPFDNVKVRQR